MSIFKSQRRQDILRISGIRAMDDAKLTVIESGRYGTDDRNLEAWTINEARQYFNKKGDPVQIVCGWDCNALDIAGPSKNDKATLSVDNICAIATRATDEALTWEEEKRKKNNVLLWVGIVVVILALSLCIPFVTAIIHSNIHVTVPHIGAFNNLLHFISEFVYG